MTDLDLDAIEARANAATDGPWVVKHEPAWEADNVQHPDVITVGAQMWEADDEPMTVCLVSTDHEDDPVDVLLDAEFIAHARTDVPALVAALREARTEVERLTADAGKRLSWAIFAVRDHDAYAQPFVLMRDTDVSGVSGTGIVADGVAFPDGTVALRWRGGNPTSVVFHDNGVESVEAILEHGGATRLVWLAEDLETTAEVAATYDERDDWRRRYEALRDGVTGLHFRDARGGCASCIDPNGFSVWWPCETAAVVARVEES